MVYKTLLRNLETGRFESTPVYYHSHQRITKRTLETTVRKLEITSSQREET